MIVKVTRYIKGSKKLSFKKNYQLLSSPQAEKNVSTLSSQSSIHIVTSNLCAQWLSHVRLCDPMDYSPPASPVHGIFQARILTWVAISFSKGSFWPSRPGPGLSYLYPHSSVTKYLLAWPQSVSSHPNLRVTVPKLPILVSLMIALLLSWSKIILPTTLLRKWTKQEFHLLSVPSPLIHHASLPLLPGSLRAWGTLSYRFFPFLSCSSSYSVCYTPFSRLRNLFFLVVSSVQFSRSVVSDSLRPHESQHARPSCPSPTPRVHPNSCPSSWWYHPATSSSVVPFSSCPQSLPASRSFPLSQLFAWGGQSIGVSALASVLPRTPRTDFL